MADEVTSGFTTIEEVTATAGSPEQHLRIEIEDFLGDSSPGLNSYINLGKWTPSTTALTVESGELAAPVPAPDLPSAFVKDTATGDDLLAAFIQNTYLDDTRDRFDGSVTSDQHAKPAVDFSKFAQPPRLSEALAATDDSDFFPAADPTGPFYLSQRVRQAVTRKMPSFVGWRDHTEGHRITTTRGDKIEIVGGNYKLISLGRGMGTVQTEWAGGHRVNVLEAPGNVTSVNWRPVPTEAGAEPGWQWVEETVKGNIVERFHGTMRTEHYGDEVIEIVGRSDESQPDAVDDFSETADQTGTFQSLAESAEENNRWDGIGGLPPKRQKPAMVSKTRGSYAFTEINAAEAYVDIDRAKEWHDFTGCEPQLDAAGNVETQNATANFAPEGKAAFRDVELRSDSAAPPRPNLVRTHMVAGKVTESRRAKHIFERVECDNYVAELDMTANERWIGAFTEVFVGNKTQVVKGFFTSLMMPLAVEAFAGVQLSVIAGLSLDIGLYGKGVELGYSWDVSCLVGKSYLQQGAASLNRAETTLAAYDADALLNYSAYAAKVMS